MKRFKIPFILFCVVTSGIALYACSKKSDVTANTVSDETAVDIAKVVKSKFLSQWVTVDTGIDYITIKSDGEPHNHKSPYWGAGDSLYEDFQSGHSANPHLISVQNYTMTIPRKPTEASTHEATSLMAIGMALNGVAIFNNQEAGGTAIDEGIISSLDPAGAHPAQRGDYHYHVTGKYTTEDDDNLVGFLRDGFPLYGRKDMDGTYPSDLDEYNGHFGATADFPSGIYHYHVQNINYLNTGYYILKSGSYYGTKGTFTF